MIYPKDWREWGYGNEQEAISDPEVTPAALHIVLRGSLPLRNAKNRRAALVRLQLNPAWELLCLEDPSLLADYQYCEELEDV